MLFFSVLHNLERHFEETHVGTNTEFYDSTGMVTNILVWSHVHVVEKDRGRVTPEKFGNPALFLRFDVYRPQ